MMQWSLGLDRCEVRPKKMSDLHGSYDLSRHINDESYTIAKLRGCLQLCGLD